jgi:hypothetical protein
MAKVIKKIRLPDGTIQKIRVDESLSAEEVRQKARAYFGIKERAPDVPPEEDVITQREALEREMQVAEQERQVAQRRFEGSQDTPLENLLEGVQEMSAAGVGAVADVATFVASPVTELIERTTGVDVPTGREALRKIDPRLDPDQTFMEEREVAGVVRGIGETVPLGAGFIPVTRDPSKLSSAVQDILGLGMTETAVATNVATAAKRGFDLETEEGIKEFADDAALRYDVEVSRPKFQEYEEYKNKVLPEYETKMKKLGEEWDKITARIDKAEDRLRSAIESGSEGRITKAQAALEKEVVNLNTLEMALEDAPVAPAVGGSTAERRAFIKQELRSAGVSEETIKQVVLPQRYRKTALFEDLMQYDLDSMRGVYDIDLRAATDLSKKRSIKASFARGWRPVSSLVSHVAGDRAGKLFETSFETAARKSELFLARYLDKKTQNDFSELTEWAEQRDIKAQFLDLRTAESPEQAQAMLKELFSSASSSLTKEANALFKQLIADSRKHQSVASKIYREDVLKDELFWASGTKKAEQEFDFAPERKAGATTIEGAQKRTRGLASEMSPEQLDEYANPIIEQVNRIASEQTLLELSNSFRVRPALSIGDDSRVFFNQLAKTISKQAGSEKVGDLVSDLAHSTFVGSRSAPAAWLQQLMRYGYGGTLGQFDSAFLNLHDAAVAMVKNGVKPTLKAMMDREGMDIREFGIGNNSKNIGEFQAGFDATMESSLFDDFSSWYQDIAFKASGFQAADRIGKGIIIRSSLNKFRELAKQGNKYFDELEVYANPAELTKIRKSLVSGKSLDEMPEDVAEIVLRMSFSRLGEQQLISAAGRPLSYLRTPWLRPAYALTGFAIKQSEIMRQGLIQNIKKGKWKDAGNFAARYMMFAGLGYGIINQMRGIPQAMLGDENRIPTAEGVILDTLSQPVQVATFGKLGTPYANREFSKDPLNYMVSSFIPPFGLIGNLLKDAADLVAGRPTNYETLRSIPGGDELRAALKED